MEADGGVMQLQAKEHKGFPAHARGEEEGKGQILCWIFRERTALQTP